MHKRIPVVQRNFVGIRCARCASSIPVSSSSPVCHKCGGRLEVIMDLDSTKKDVTKESFNASTTRGVWRYRLLLPCMNPKAIVCLGEGNTNLLLTESLAQVLGSKRLFVKDETTNPSGAFIDRGTTVDISRARALGFRAAACGWSGNLASSVAAYCARGGLRSRAYLPGQIDLGKLYQTVAYGAEIVPCSTREEAFASLCENQEEYYPVTARNPFFLEGVKTTGIEVAEQMDWNPPDWMIVPMGNGSHVAMTHKGLKEIETLGIIDRDRTRLVGVQMEGCSPIADMFKRTPKKSKYSSCSFARDIAIENPSMAEEAVRAIASSRGDAVVVTEKEVLNAVELLAKSEGIFAEPASASTIAALRKMLESGAIDRSESVVCMVTGIGLKDPMMARSIAYRNKAARNMISRFEESLPAKRIGTTKLKILSILGDGENYAYAIRKAIALQSGKELSLVCIFQHLRELTDLGLISLVRQERSSARRMRVYYSLTDRGQEFLKRQA